MQVPILPIRNWNVPMQQPDSNLYSRTDSTYKELKQLECIGDTLKLECTDSTYKELKRL